MRQSRRFFVSLVVAVFIVDDIRRGEYVHQAVSSAAPDERRGEHKPMSKWSHQLLVISFSFVISSAHGAEPPMLTVAGRVAGSARKHTVHVALWSAEGFLEAPRAEIRIAAGSDLRFEFKVKPGRWAVSAYEDRNENGVLDMGLFGPKEPSGFWPPFRGWHKPRFDEVASTIDKNISSAEVVLK